MSNVLLLDTAIGNAFVTSFSCVCVCVVICSTIDNLNDNDSLRQMLLIVGNNKIIDATSKGDE